MSFPFVSADIDSAQDEQSFGITKRILELSFAAILTQITLFHSRSALPIFSSLPRSFAISPEGAIATVRPPYLGGHSSFDHSPLSLVISLYFLSHMTTGWNTQEPHCKVALISPNRYSSWPNMPRPSQETIFFTPMVLLQRESSTKVS
ncbi:uncharacterized protein LOC120204476 [Hibiscus syriacus]|uniref:uncharacterized protein LOC120204476 n=1 Tax=Hibiscus syriacus TaxID=106335 RepID=UPI001921DA22|nr:uncharacterized protein LOC120204476 [Hibiscus syriacus]